MWPLCIQGARKDECDAVSTRRSIRSYYNKFIDEWKRVHIQSLRELPDIEATATGFATSFELGVRNEAAAFLEGATTRARATDDIVVGSCWEAVHQLLVHQLLLVTDPTPTEETTVFEEDEEIKMDLVKLLDRDEDIASQVPAQGVMPPTNRREDSSIVALAINSTLVSASNTSIEGRVDLTRFGMLHLTAIAHVTESRRMLPSSSCSDQSPRDPAQFSETTKAALQILPTPAVPIHEGAIRCLVDEARQVLRSVPAQSIGVESNLTADFPSIFDSMDELSIAPEEKAASNEAVLPSLATLVDMNQKRECELRWPQQVRFDGAFARPFVRSSMSHQLDDVLRGVWKRNAALSIITAIPATLNDDIRGVLSRAQPTMVVRNAFSPSCAVPTLIALPAKVVNDDELKISRARATLLQEAARFLRSTPNPPISLTNVAISIPSVWMMDWVLDHVKEHRASIRRLAVPAEKRVQGVAVAEDISAKCEESAKEVEHDRAVAADEEVALVVFKSERTGETSKHRPSPETRTRLMLQSPEAVSTDALVESFLNCNVNEYKGDTIRSSSVSRDKQIPVSAPAASVVQYINKLARPGVWFLARSKRLNPRTVDSNNALGCISGELLTAIILQLQVRLKTIVPNPGGASHDEIVELCTAFRHAVWLHSLRILIDASNLDALVPVVAAMGKDARYRKVYGANNTQELWKLHIYVGGAATAPWDDEVKAKPAEPVRKKSRVDIVQRAKEPVSVLCSMRLFEKDELLEELTEMAVTLLERELPVPIDIIVDEHNAICLMSSEDLSDEKLMKAITFDLAQLQLQFDKIWLLIDENSDENIRHAFYTALIQFSGEVQTLVTSDERVTASIIREIVNVCASDALSRHHVLPKLWFGRPFLLEEESQLERLLSSTKIMNPFAAQSALHRLSLEELVTRPVQELAPLLRHVLSKERLATLWRMLHEHHGIGTLGFG